MMFFYLYVGSASAHGHCGCADIHDEDISSPCGRLVLLFFVQNPLKYRFIHCYSCYMHDTTNVLVVSNDNLLSIIDKKYIDADPEAFDSINIFAYTPYILQAHV